MIEVSSRDVLIWLNSLNVSNKAISKILKQIPQLEELWILPSDRIHRLKGIKDEVKEKILLNRNKDYFNRLFTHIEKKGINMLTIFDKSYPETLHHIYDNPKVLYTKGDIIEEDTLAIAIVGSRKATGYGKWATEKFVEELIKLDVTIVSGLALGIDSVAHRKAIECNGRTIAVLGNGLDTIYPKRNRDLYEIVPDNGALITEYPLGTPPLPYNFPLRNRIISGLSLGVMVMEAKERSGTLITAAHALEQGKEIFALPGNINSLFSRGTNKLIKDGAKLIMDIDDILEEVYELQIKIKKEKEKKLDYSGLSPAERMILSIVEKGPIHCDSIVMETKLDIATVNSTLTVLELKGIIKEMSSNIFSLS